MTTAEALRFRLEHVASQHGQRDYTMLAYDGNVAVGYVDYTIFQGELSIRMVEVRDTYRRRGIGRQMIAEVAREHPDLPIEVFGDVLSEQGAAFVQGLSQNPPPGELLVVGPDGVLQRLALDGVRLDIPNTRDLLFRSLMYEWMEHGAVAIELWEGGEPVDTLHFAEYDFRADPKGEVHRFRMDLYDALDDLLPPPRSGTRMATRRPR